MAPSRPAEIPPRPAEINTSHTGSTLWKNFAGVHALLQGFRGYTRGCVSVPPRNGTTIMGRTSHQEAPAFAGSYGYLGKGSGATVGDGHKGPLITGENHPFLKNNEQSSLQTASHATHRRGPRQGRAHDPESLCSPISSRLVAPLWRTFVSLEEQAPHHESSASLEGLTPLG
jgi:hypothetical protein